MLKKIWIAVGTIGFTSFLGCAAAQKEQVTQQEKPAAPAVAQAPAPAQDPNADLQKMLQDTVLHFDFNKDLLTSESTERLQKIAQTMKEHPSAHVKIAGNCDERGTQEYNLALGQRRADAAKQYLVSLGVSPDRVSTLSYGDQQPVASGHNEEAWAANRRDDIEPMTGR